VVEPLGLATTVGLAFTVAASTFAPLIILGVWWRGLSVPGAMAGLLVGGVGTGVALATTMVRGDLGGWPGALLANPALWTVPLAFATAAVVSLATPGRVPASTTRVLVRLHTPERVTLARSRLRD
jgi:cation/acetate symporter